MTIERPLPAATRAALEQAQAPDALLAFLTIEHPSLSQPIRVVSDVLPYVFGGAQYEGMPFEFQLLAEDETAPTTQLRIQNVDRKIGAALRRATDRATVRIDILSSADFDLTQIPRVELSAATPIYGFRYFELVDVQVDAIEISGRVFLRDYSQEPWPGVLATQSRCPGLFR